MCVLGQHCVKDIQTSVFPRIHPGTNTGVSAYVSGMSEQETYGRSAQAKRGAQTRNDCHAHPPDEPSGPRQSSVRYASFQGPHGSLASQMVS